jgi:hypothetical protein
VKGTADSNGEFQTATCHALTVCPPSRGRASRHSTKSVHQSHGSNNNGNTRSRCPFVAMVLILCKINFACLIALLTAQNLAGLGRSESNA